MTNEPELLLIGDPVAHSRSPAFQNAGLRALGFDWTYEARRVDDAGVAGVFRSLRGEELRGFNVTAPHKERAFSLCDERTSAAMATGATNTVWLEDGRAWGDNTDVQGVRASLRALDARGGVAVVLGAGGAAAAALVALSGWEEVIVVNRTLQRSEALVARVAGSWERAQVLPWCVSPQLADGLSRADIIVHAASTPTGDDPLARYRSLPLEALSAGAAALDLNYSVDASPFMALVGADRRAIDGATMLLHQGCAAFERWTGQPAPVDVMREALALSLGRAPASIG